MKEYIAPVLRRICAAEGITVSAWDEWSFKPLSAGESPSFVDINIDDNPEGNPD